MEVRIASEWARLDPDAARRFAMTLEEESLRRYLLEKVEEAQR
jgi:hypothetical protein